MRILDVQKICRGEFFHWFKVWNLSCYLVKKNIQIILGDLLLLCWATVCSLNIVLFPKNSRKFVTSPSPAPGCYWLYKTLPANWSDCTLAFRWELWMSYRDVGEAGVAVNCEKTQFFLNFSFFKYPKSYRPAYQGWWWPTRGIPLRDCLSCPF